MYFLSNLSFTCLFDSMLKCLQGLSLKDLVTGTSFESPTGVVKAGDGNPVWPVMDSYSR